MRYIKIGKAHSNTEIPLRSVGIIIDDEVDTGAEEYDWETVQREVYDAQARDLERALCAALPGGTYNRLLAQMLERKAGLLRIPLGG